MKTLQAIGNSIHPSIQLEIDYPSRHSDRKMPTLDLKIWVTYNNNSIKILHEHYMKPMSSKVALNSTNCGRFDCLPCTSEGSGSCRSVGVNYDIYCCDCEEIDDEKVYHGQTARTGYIRGEEHLDDLKK